MKKINLFFLLLAFLSPAAFAALPTTAVLARKQFSVTAEEWKRLKNGEVVVRSYAEDSPDLGGTALALVPQPSWRIWQTITDFPEYPHFFPRNIGASVTKQDKDSLVVETKLQTIPNAPPIWNESEIRLDRRRPDLMLMSWNARRTTLKSNQGFWLLEKKGLAETLIIYQTRFQLANMSSSMARPHAEQTLVGNLKAIVKQSGTERYDKKPGSTDLVWAEAKASKVN